jgi:outer membrane protein OmpA-like peptidoglycan-associated protein
MKSTPLIFPILFATGLSAQIAGSQEPVHPADPQPIYRVTVVSRSLQAVNYEHRGGPTMIDFQGTVLLPHAKGEAVVESKRGRIMINAKFEHLEPPTKYGTEYLTYVLWAITPEGRAKNLGEVLANSSNKAHVDVTTDLQALGLIVTAEPYYSVTIPSDVVVLENVVRPDTIGTREMVTARYDLLPRGGYVMNVQHGQLRYMGPETVSLPYDQYEAVLELYQAENAVQIARSLGADRFAPESFNKAVTLLENARGLQATKDTHMVVSTAREAAQMAEDARVISVKRRDEERQREVQSQDDARVRRAQAEAELAQAQAAAERADAERASVQRAREEAEEAQRQEADREAALHARVQAPPPIEATPVPRAKFELTGVQRQSRAELFQLLSATLETRDTPRGLIISIPDSLFEPGRGNMLRPTAVERLMRIATVVKARPDLLIRVEGFTDDHGTAPEDQDVSQRRAEAVREMLVRHGVAPGLIAAAGYGRSRPIASNATASGREQNRRVEIDIDGPGIGEMPLWERTYSLKP